MNPPGEAAREGSVLQKRFGLADLLDRDVLQEVCRGYAELFQVGFKVLDGDGQVLVDAKGAGDDFCSYLFTFPRGKNLCTSLVSELRHLRPEADEPLQRDCFSGLRYLLLGLRHEGNVIGKIIFGPFLPAEGQPPELAGLGEKFRAEIAERLRGKVRRVPTETAKRVSIHLVRVLEAVLFIGYKHALTSRMHVESVTVSYNELQQKNRALQESLNRLQELDRLKSNFLATVSHELRTPLTSVIGYSEMLLEGLAGQLSTEQREYVNTVMEKGEQLLGIINGILDFSKMEAGAVVLNRSPTNLLEVARSTLVTIMPMARKAGVEVSLSTAADLPAVLADRDKIQQVMLNLVGNAVKFNRPGGTVEVRLELARMPRERQEDADLPRALVPLQDQYLRIQVRDTGVGIPQEQLSHIFDSFYQVDGSSTREFGGTGLGLTIARGLVEAHGGFIEVSSRVSEGSTFSIFLPLNPAET